MTLLYFTLFALFAPPVQVVIDPGHGGSNLGAIAFDGKTPEKSLTLDLAQRLTRELQKRGIRSRLTRQRDRYMTLLARTAFARKQRANCFISLHFNASPLHNQSGVEIFYPEAAKAPELEELTHLGQSASLKGPSVRGLIIDSYLTTLGRSVSWGGSKVLAKKLSWRLLGDGFSLRQVRDGPYDILIGSGTKAILFEGGFIDNPKEGAKVLTASYRQKLAYSLGRGLAALCKTSHQLH